MSKSVSYAIYVEEITRDWGDGSPSTVITTAMAISDKALSSRKDDVQWFFGHEVQGGTIEKLGTIKVTGDIAILPEAFIIAG